jgi:hypothetical protein
MPKRDRACGGKVAHASKEAAAIAAKKMCRVGMNVYRCPKCGGWHIGKTRDPARSANRVTALLERHRRDLEQRMRPSEAAGTRGQD